MAQLKPKMDYKELSEVLDKVLDGDTGLKAIMTREDIETSLSNIRSVTSRTKQEILEVVEHTPVYVRLGSSKFNLFTSKLESGRYRVQIMPEGKYYKRSVYVDEFGDFYVISDHKTQVKAEMPVNDLVERLEFLAML